MTYHKAPNLEKVTWLERWAERNEYAIAQAYLWVFLLAFAALQAWALTLAAESLYSELEAPKASLTTPAISVAPGATSDVPDPCGLKDVVCPGEKRVIKGTVYTYQAVPEQTDDTPCVGAMPGVDFCNPQGAIVANNCLELGSYVGIRGDVYYVADRMDERYGCDVFDILIRNDEKKDRNFHARGADSTPVATAHSTLSAPARPGCGAGGRRRALGGHRGGACPTP